GGASALRRDDPAHGSRSRGCSVRAALVSSLYRRGPRAARPWPGRPAVATGALACRPGRGRAPAVHPAAASRAALPTVRLRDRRRGGRPCTLLVYAATTPSDHALIFRPRALEWSPEAGAEGQCARLGDPLEPPLPQNPASLEPEGERVAFVPSKA